MAAARLSSRRVAKIRNEWGGKSSPRPLAPDFMDRDGTRGARDTAEWTAPAHRIRDPRRPGDAGLERAQSFVGESVWPGHEVVSRARIPRWLGPRVAT